MCDRAIDQDELRELMSNGWSYPLSSGGGVFSTEELIDPITGRRYRLHVQDRKLTMTEIIE